MGCRVLGSSLHLGCSFSFANYTCTPGWNVDMFKACMSESSTETNVNSPDASWGLLCMCCDKQAPTEICMEVVPTASWGTCGNERKKKPARACNVKYTRQAFLHQFVQCVFLRLGYCVGLQAPLQFFATRSEILSKRHPKLFKMQDMWRPWVTFCSILAAVSVLETTLCIQSVFLFSYKKEAPEWTSFGVHFGVYFVKAAVGK